MARLTRPSSLLWGPFLALGGVALALHLRAPGHPALTWITTFLLALLALRVVALVRYWRLGRIPATRILLPTLILAEGLGLVLTQASRPALQLRLGTALALELLLLILAVRALRNARSLPGTWPEDRIAAAFEAFVPPWAAVKLKSVPEAMYEVLIAPPAASWTSGMRIIVVHRLLSPEV